MRLTVVYYCLYIINTLSVNFHYIKEYVSIYFHLGKPPQYKPYLIDLSIPFLWTSAFYFNKDDSSSLTQIQNVNYTLPDNPFLKFQNFTDELTLNCNGQVNITLLHFPFLFTYSLTHLYESIGLGLFTETTKQYSLIHRLYSSKIIQEELFAIDMPHNKLYFGTFPQVNKTTSLIYIGSCKSGGDDGEYTGWGCKVNGVSLYSNEYYFIDVDSNYVFFNINTPYIFASQRYMEYLYKEVFGSMIKQNICKVVDDDYRNDKMLLCDNKVFQMNSAFMELVFTHTDNKNNDNTSQFKLFISYNELFTLYDDNKYKLNIQLNKNNNSFIIGTPLFTNYISIFNYPNTSISFFSTSLPTNHSPSPPHSTSIPLIILILKYLSLLLILILLNYYYTNTSITDLG